jgi:biopolymer transport protein ExbD
MSMNVKNDDGDEHVVMSEINTTPLVDIMLVLLIIFLITIPIITKTVPLHLPKVANIPTKTKPENITISVDGQGQIWWNGQLVPDRDALIRRVVVEAVKVPQPEVHIRGDAGVRYEAIGRTL